MSSTNSLNKIVILFFGLKRSGQHAVIEWIAEHHTGNKKNLIALANNLQSIPIKTFRTLHYWNAEKSIEVLRLTEHENPCLKKYLLFVTFEDIYRKWKSIEWCIGELIDNIEDIGGAEIILPIINLRDFYNNMASRIAMSRSRRPTTPTPHGFRPEAIEWWKKQAREFQSLEEAIPINYNHLISVFEYRRRMERWLYNDGLDIGDSEKADHHLSSSIAHKDYGGHGSSFTGFREPPKLQPLERYKQVMDDPWFELVLQDQEAARLNQEIFGWRL